MDPVPGSNNVKPKTAMEEVTIRVAAALDKAIDEYENLSVFSFGKRLYVRGVIKALSFVFELLHDLYHKYENSRGDFN